VVVAVLLVIATVALVVQVVVLGMEVVVALHNLDRHKLFALLFIQVVHTLIVDMRAVA
jgi:hypothetical protein